MIEKAKLVALYTRPGAPMPNEREFEKLFLQTEIIAGITKTNVSLFGEPKFFSIYYEYMDLYFFLLSKPDRRGVLVVQIVEPYDHKEIVSLILEQIAGN
ncbi:MAG TPA: hypothetical protein VHL10_06235 [Nitrososphaera sp.]|jgi:hypothetical protein|nr:hypothetical protein [Nitrososphaera sp.]